MAKFVRSPTKSRRLVYRLAVGVLACCVFALTSGPTTITAATDPTLRVMQWNIHKTKDSTGACNPNFTVDTILAQNPQVVSMNEINFFSGVCAPTSDMGLQLQSLIQQKSGQTWYYQSVNAGGVGNVLLSRYQPVASGSTLLSNNRGVAQMTINVNGRNVNVFSTHVEYDVAAWRPVQITEAVQW